MGFFSSSNNGKFKIGDRVRIKYRGEEGYIIDKNGDLYMVSVDNGAFVDSYTEDELEKCW